MLDVDFLKEILERINTSPYSGVSTKHLFDEFAEKEAIAEGEKHSESEYKFKYHMDEAWSAGLIRSRNSMDNRNWGLTVNVNNDWIFVSKTLVLTPLGCEFLKELNQPKGPERLIKALRSAGSTAGKEALRVGVGVLLKGVM